MRSDRSFHEDLSRRPQVRTSSDRSFGVVFALVFTVIALWPLVSGATPRWWALLLALAFVTLAALRPGWLAPLNRLWTRFGLLLHRITSPLILGLLFFLVITPFGLIRRLIARDPLRLRFEPEAPSYWIRREPPGPAPETIKNQF
jgi:hypothetical protein